MLYASSSSTFGQVLGAVPEACTQAHMQTPTACQVMVIKEVPLATQVSACRFGHLGWAQLFFFFAREAVEFLLPRRGQFI